ncbi:MAG TPA: F0F1 ATP synthase subunit B [Gemmataceae bacterium]|nr:F0F1 ATP synthase subunit B [Gemmataceae bacterium]
MRSLTGWLVGVMLALTLSAPPVMAEAASKDEHGANEGGKIDVADKFGLKRYDLGIYTLIVFGILLFVLGRYAWGPMMAGLDKREATLRRFHEEAEGARKEAQLALAEVQARLAKTHEEVRLMLDEARRDAQVVKDQMKASAASEIQADRDRVRREIETAKDQALKEIYEQSVQLAALVSTKAIQRELTPADHARLLDDALADLRTNMATRT